MSDRITLRDLEVHYRVGVPDEERSRPQRLLITVEMDHGFGPAAAADDLTLTIDYSAVARRLLLLGQGREWRLIETLAVEIAELVLREFRPRRVGVEIRKFIIPQAREVSVRVERAANG